MPFRWPWVRWAEITRHADRVDNAEPKVEEIHREGRRQVRENHIGPLLENLFVTPPPGGTRDRKR